MEGSSRISMGTSGRGALPRKRKLVNKLSCFCFVVVLGLGLKRWDLVLVLEASSARVGGGNVNTETVLWGGGCERSMWKMLESGLSGGCPKLGVCREELTVLHAVLQAVLGVQCAQRVCSVHSKVSGIVPLLQTKGAKESPGLSLHSA